MSAEQSQPNVLWILCDELRADALSCYGSPVPTVSTPNIDALAADGVLFERSFTASPVCVPARTTLLTGLRPDETGVYGNEAQAAGHPLDPVPVTFTELLAKHGWSTADYGKEHVPPQLAPWQSSDVEGSDMRELLAAAAAACASVQRTPLIGHVVAGRLPQNAEFPSTAITENTLAALRRSTAPFFIRASYLQPHTPVIVPEPWASRYDDVIFPEPTTEDQGISEFERRFGAVNGGTTMTWTEVQEAQRAYHSAVAWVDDQIGALLNDLSARGLDEDTIVVLTSDHGAHLGEHGAYGKHTFAPQSHRVPLIVRWPRKLLGGQRRADLASGQDLARTLLGLCGVDALPQMGGRDLFSDAAPSLIISSIGYGAAQSRAFPNLDAGTWSDERGWPQRFCVRTTRYRLDMNVRIDGVAPEPSDRDVFLADSLIDPLELCNRAADPVYENIRDQLTEVVLAASERAVQPSDDAVFANFQPPA